MSTPTKTLDQIKQENFEKLESQRLKQAAGDAEQIPANKNDKYQISEFDKGAVHVRRVIKENRPELQTYIPHEDFQMFSPEYYEANKEMLSSGFGEFEVIHYPEKKGKKGQEQQGTGSEQPVPPTEQPPTDPTDPTQPKPTNPIFPEKPEEEEERRERKRKEDEEKEKKQNPKK
jgi:hypothetical protein